VWLKNCKEYNMESDSLLIVEPPIITIRTENNER
jgi:hypothetical protein